MLLQTVPPMGAQKADAWYIEAAPSAPVPPRPAATGRRVVCLVTIKMPDGSCGEHTGIYPHSCDAVTRALDLFPEAGKVSVFAWPFPGGQQ